VSPIEKGSPYGRPDTPLPQGGVVVGSDAEAREVLEEARHVGRRYPALGLTGGDLCRTLGGPAGLSVSFPVDLGEVLIDGRLHLFVSHLWTHTRLWRYAFMANNSQWAGARNVAPRAHPGDGLLDTYEARLGWADWWKVGRRLPRGAHLPHPGIKERRVAALAVELPRALPVWLDATPVGKGRMLAIRVEPDALTVVV
jgi:hypothetical protein